MKKLSIISIINFTFSSPFFIYTYLTAIIYPETLFIPIITLPNAPYPNNSPSVQVNLFSDLSYILFLT